MGLFEAIATRLKEAEKNFNFRAYFKDGGHIEFSPYGMNPPLKRDEFLCIVESSSFEDSQKQEIFNGDIFDWGNSSRGIVTIKKGQWVIENNNGDFSVFGYKGDGKVVGNIIENEELLEHEDLKNNLKLREF